MHGGDFNGFQYFPTEHARKAFGHMRIFDGSAQKGGQRRFAHLRHRFIVDSPQYSRCRMYLRFLAAAFVAALTITASAQTAPIRPEITGISHLAVYASDPAVTDHYYREVIGAAREPDPENPLGVRYAFNDRQFIEVLPLPPGADTIGSTTRLIAPRTPKGCASTCGPRMEDTGQGRRGC